MSGEEGAVQRQRICERATQYFGRRVQRARQARGWTQADLSKHVGCSRPIITRLEKGQRPPTGEQVFILCSVLDIPMADVIAGEDADRGGAPQHGLAMSRSEIIGLITFRFERDDCESLRFLRMIDLRRTSDEELEMIFRKVWGGTLGDDDAAA